jgi:hypothetical protein
MTKIPVVYLHHLTEEQAKAYMLADNKLTGLRKTSSRPSTRSPKTFDYIPRSSVTKSSWRFWHPKL